MQDVEIWKLVTMDKANFLEKMLGLLIENQLRYCVIGGQAVNAYTEPMITLDLDLVIAVKDLAEVETLLGESFRVARFPHSLNITLPDTNLRVQIQTDPRYADFVERASYRTILGIVMPVATPIDVLQGKVWAVQDERRRASKRQKDLADILRLLEEFPQLKEQVPGEIRALLFKPAIE